MDDKIVVDLDLETLDALARRAEAHGHSVGEEVRTIVQETVSPVREDMDWVGRARAIRAMTVPGSIHVDSTKLIRASRDFDH
ncbi:MAG: FitA-like ribbon-helix-helix domain-containing protein [Devosia sp.]